MDIYFLAVFAPAGLPSAGLAVAVVAVALAHPGTANAAPYNEWQAKAGRCLGGGRRHDRR